VHTGVCASRRDITGQSKKKKKIKINRDINKEPTPFTCGWCHWKWDKELRYWTGIWNPSCSEHVSPNDVPAADYA
jgi:hypothetical protein